MRQIRILLPACLLALPGAALAGPDQAPPVTAAPSEHRLSPDEIKTILDTAARKREAAEPAAEGLPEPIHGEIGLSVGTGGYRSAFGTAVVPLPGEGVAILSLGTDRFGPGRDLYFQER